MPFQYLLADAILCMGRSTELVKMFNRLGIVASLDTHDRIATTAAAQRINKGSGRKQGEEIALFPGLHAQLLSLAVRKAGEGLDGFIT